MVGSLQRKALWQYSHSASILFAVLLFTAGFLCTLLWTNDIVHTETSTGGAMTNTFTQFSPAVSTFNITYQVAIFGAAWNAILYVTLLVLEGEALPISTIYLRYEIERAACIIAVVGNAVYSLACIALMSVLAELAANASTTINRDRVDREELTLSMAKAIASSGNDRRAGQGVTAAIAGLAAVAAVWACVMDWLHKLHSSHRRTAKGVPDGEDKQA